MTTYRTTRPIHSNPNINTGFGLLFILLWLAVVGAAAGGWVWNIIKIFVTGGDPITAWFIIRVIGVFMMPVGAVLGYL